MSAAELESAGDSVPGGVDVHTTAGKLADFERRVQEATHAGSERAVEKQHAAGKMTARERIVRMGRACRKVDLVEEVASMLWPYKAVAAPRRLTRATQGQHPPGHGRVPTLIR